MTIFEAKQYDPAKERRKRIIIVSGIVLVIVLAIFGWRFRHWPYEHRVNQFFDALQQKNYEGAYSIWMNDAHWKQHPQKYKNYDFHEFYIDWGPGGDWGLINSHKVIGSVAPPNGSGVVVAVEVNGRTEKANIWVEKGEKTLTFSPYETK
jgi:hypothetical protein